MKVQKKKSAIVKAEPRVDKRMMVLKTQEIVSRSHQSKLRNDLSKLKITVAKLRSGDGAIGETVAANLLDQITLPMTGTFGSTYTPLFATTKGRVGVRSLGAGEFRIRIQPAVGTLLKLPSNWTTPGHSEETRRYSIVSNDLPNALKDACAALLA